MKATREAFGNILPVMGDTNENILALDADLGGATKIRALSKSTCCIGWNTCWYGHW